MNVLALQGAAAPHLDSGDIATRLGIVLFLVALNGFFVASEFGLVAVRRSRIDEMAANGDGGARVVQKALTHLDRYIAGTQLGITFASLALGWVGEPALGAILDGLLSSIGMELPDDRTTHSALSLGLGFFILTFLHIVLGELAPKSLALVNPEGVAKFVARPLILF